MPNRPYRLGLEPKILGGTGPQQPSQRMRIYSFLQSFANPDSLNQFRGLLAPSNRHQIRRYSAATTSFGLGLAADIMKSEMRGTISERNREPLNTP